MRVIDRFGYYLGGFSVGLIFLGFVFSGKKPSCNYGPSARVKNNLLQKKIAFSPNDNNKIFLSDSALSFHEITSSTNISELSKLPFCASFVDIILMSAPYSFRILDLSIKSFSSSSVKAKQSPFFFSTSISFDNH